MDQVTTHPTSEPARETKAANKKAKSAAYYLANKEQFALSNKRWREANKDKIEAYEQIKKQKRAITKALRVARRAARYEASREHRLAIGARWREANKEKVKAAQLDYYQKNKETIKARSILWKLQHPDRSRCLRSESRKRWVIKNPDKARELRKRWKLRHPENDLACKRRKRQRQKQTKLLLSFLHLSSKLNELKSQPI